MSFESARRFLATIKLGPFPFTQQTFEVHLVPSETVADFSRVHLRGMFVLRQRLIREAVDRNNSGLPIDLTFTDRSHLIPDANFLRRDYLLRLVRDFLQSIAKHELDEHLLVDGERAFDPHANGRTNL